MPGKDPRDTKDVERTCRNCRCKFMARSADVKRGWAKFCSKSCKAITQTRRTGYAGPDEDQRRGGTSFGMRPHHSQDGDS
jgi:hypothetical protein